MSTRALLAVALALIVPACSVQEGGDFGEHASSSQRMPPPWMEVRDHEPEKPVIVDSIEDLARGLPRADLTQENGAAIYLKSGKILNVGGSIVDWFYVE